jgi:hypothetical protein
MEKFDNFLIPTEKHNFKKYQTNQFACYMRMEITDFLLDMDLQDEKPRSSYFDLGLFFDKYKITEQHIKDGIKTIIFAELKGLGWWVATIFGDTGLILMHSEGEINNSIWSGSFDFNIQ